MEETKSSTAYTVNICGREFSSIDGVHYRQNRDKIHDKYEFEGEDLRKIGEFFDKMDYVYGMSITTLLNAMNAVIRFLGVEIFSNDIHPVMIECANTYGNDEATVACLRVIVGVSGSNESLLRRDFPDRLVDAAMILARKNNHSCDYMNAIKENELARHVRIVELLYRIRQTQIRSDVETAIIAGYAKEVSDLINWK